MTSRSKIVAAVLLVLACIGQARAEVILQYFNTSWNEIATRMPELAEAGYTALWLPPPYQAGEQNSVGYDCFNRFNFGSGGVTTRYGTADDLLNMVRIAHRFGLRVYFDNVVNQNGGPLPDSPPGTLSHTQPGFVPEDFHLINSNGMYSAYSGNMDYTHEWPVLNYNSFGIDIAQEDPNVSFGPNVNANGYYINNYPKWSGIRQPNNPELYPDPNVITGTATDGQGNVFYPFTGHGQPATENVNAMLIRAARWFLDQGKCDGFRLDDVKGVPSYFFGEQGYSGGNKDTSTSGYGGNIQAQFNMTHGFMGSWSNLRATLFNDQSPRVNAMLWGEALGQPQDCAVTCEQNYVDAGMRVDDNQFYNRMRHAVCGFCTDETQKPPEGLWYLDQPGAYSFGVGTSLIHCGTHDYNDISVYDRASAYATLLTRAGLPSVYTDGYNEEHTLQSDNKYFPAIGNNAFLGQFKNTDPNPHFPNLLYINELFARGDQIAKWSDRDYAAYERRDKRENSGMSDSDGTVLLFMMARNNAGGQARSFSNSFPAGARLVNYSDFNGPFQATVGNDGVLRDDSNNLIIAPAGGYFAFSWSVPVMPVVWNDGIYGQVQPITILQNGQQVGTLTYNRMDGTNGDPNFNPYGVTNAIPGSYQYPMTVPRVTSPSNLTFIARADGSCANILMKLDGGMDLNSQMGHPPLTGDLRDNRPGLADDVFQGYEQMALVQRVAERFAARDVSRNVIGSPGCETYQATIGTTGFTVNNGNGPITSIGTIDWAWHDPTSNNQSASNPVLQFNPAPENAANQPITVWVKIGYTNQPQYAVLYYTTDGATYPEGSAGIGKGTTHVAPLAFDSYGGADSHGTPVWWKTTLPQMPSGTVLRYKVGVYRTDANPWVPSSASDIMMKQRMEAIYQITNFNAQTIGFYPHNDYGVWQTGLDEGFHVLRTKTFLKRDGKASIYNLNVQTFYYDTKTPEGEILFPGPNDTIVGPATYYVVVRTERTVTETWCRITDNNSTGVWTQASQSYPPNSSLNSSYPVEWRFGYTNIPTNGTASIQVRLRELTSSTNMNLTDAAGHFTTLTRTVPTGATSDHVGDGIPDAWRKQYFDINGNGASTNNFPGSCASCDPDGDGMSNLQEYLAGTDPTNPASAFRIISIAPQGNNVLVTWITAGGHTNAVQTCTSGNGTTYSSNCVDLSGPIIIPGTGSVTTNYLDVGAITNVPTRYYRVRLVP